MSVIDSLVGRINTASASIKSIGVRTPKKPEIVITRELAGVNLDAGADLLQKYHENWARISKTTSENAKKYEALDRDIYALNEGIQRQHGCVRELTAVVSQLPVLALRIDNIVAQLGRFEVDIEAVELMLLQLEDLCDRQDADNNKVHHQHELSLYKQRKNLEIEQLKLNMARDHTQKVAQYEKRLQANLREKQAALDDQFSEQIQHYKQYGKTQMKPAVVEPQVDISEVTIDEDTEALDTFLNIECTTPTTTTAQAEGGSGESSEDDPGEEEGLITPARSDIIVKSDQDIEAADSSPSSAVPPPPPVTTSSSGDRDPASPARSDEQTQNSDTESAGNTALGSEESNAKAT